MSKRSLVLFLLFCAACEPASKPVATKGATEPQIEATVITTRTTTLPANRIYTQTLVIAGDRVRFTGEQDVWRLYDVKQKSVTFVDDIDRTHRSAPVASLIAERRRSDRAQLPSHYPRLRLTRTDERQQILGVPARKLVIESGSYNRELWIGEHPAIPAGLFAMIQASEQPSTPLAPMMRDVDEALMTTEGFPLRDHSHLRYGKSELVVNRDVVSIARRLVAESLVTVPRGYRDLTPKPAPSKK